MWEAANPSSAAGFVQRVDMVEPSGTSHLYWEGLVAGLDTPDPQYHAQYAEQIRNCVRDLGVE